MFKSYEKGKKVKLDCFLRVAFHERFSSNYNLILEIFLRVKFAFVFSLDILINKQKLLDDQRHAINSTFPLFVLGVNSP